MQKFNNNVGRNMRLIWKKNVRVAHVDLVCNLLLQGSQLILMNSTTAAAASMVNLREWNLTQSNAV